VARNEAHRLATAVAADPDDANANAHLAVLPLRGPMNTSQRGILSLTQ
jgi:hypothetical protein